MPFLHFGGDFIVWIVLIVLVVIAFLVSRILKIPKFGNMVLITGGVKTGKSTMTVWLAVRQYWRQLRKYYICNYFIYPVFHWIPLGPFRRMKKREKPLFYSNIPIAVKNFVPLTRSLIQRTERFRYGSVIYVCESSLVADSQAIKDPLINEEMLLLNKLIAHETKGGYIFYDTQSIMDNHYAVKRCLSSYFYIHHSLKIPFFMLSWVRELKFSEDNSAVNTFEDDVEETLRLVIIPKKVWKLFDCYCYSVLTDHLPVVDRTVPVFRFGDKKACKIVTFRNYQSIPKEFLDDGKKQNES
ncbi:MAG: hypothetical protein E7663_01610 [Ruminococcaceae bacterium]|nr:hypothetical protein [Oscillospiraceae bacterium]